MADITVSADIDTLLQSASNSAARTNLGLGTAATTAATAYATAAQGTKVDFLTVTQAVDLDQAEIDIAANNAKVTADTTNVTSAGAVMDSELTDIAAVKALDQGVATTDDVIHATLDVVHTAAATDDHALEIDADAAGFGDVKAVDIVYTTGAIATGQDEAIILANIDESLATGGHVAGLEVLATEGSANVYGMLVGAGVNPVEHLSGSFGDMDSALVNATDRLTEFTTAGSDIQMFVADNDTITIGDAAKFQELEFLLAIAASGSGIDPTFEFSTGVGTWTAFTPVDGTNGMRNNGVIAWLDADIPTWAVGTGSEYLIRVTRTRNSLTTPPTESKVQIAAITEYSWNNGGDIAVRNIAATGTVTGVPIHIQVAASDETTALTTGTAKLTIRAPSAFTLTAVRASVSTAPTGATIIVDVNEAGTSVLSTKLSIDATEKTSTTAATAAVISDSAIADDAELTIDIDQIGSTIAGAGLKITLIGTL